MVNDSALVVSDEISIPLAEIEMSAVRSRGAGGQNVNKVATAIHLRFDFLSSASLSDKIKERLLSLRDQRVSRDGVIVIKSQQYRSQENNRAAALDRLTKLLRAASIAKKPRRATRPSKAAREKRVDDKVRRGRLKEGRGKIVD